ncbi:MAG: hypothetical protein HY016_06645 [Nitrosomonadales bacterium]|nr:hypothetical protein [Nitrosomonadales bacterium]
MNQSGSFLKMWLGILICAVLGCLGAGIAVNALAKDEPAKKAEPVKQSGNILVKFKAHVSDAKIQEVADYYGARHVNSLNDNEASTHKDAEQWRKLRFESVDDLKDIARRMFQDNRVDEVE